MEDTRNGLISRALLLLTTGLFLLLPTGCGYNLMRVRRDVTFRTETGQVWQTKAWLRPRWGALELDGNFDVGGSGDAACVLLGVVALCELADDVGSSCWALAAMFDEDLEVAYGPWGWFLSILPMVTLIPPDVPLEGVSFTISDEHFAVLRDGTSPERERILAEIRERHRYELVRLAADE